MSFPTGSGEGHAVHHTYLAGDEQVQSDYPLVISQAFMEMAGQPYRGRMVAGPFMASMRDALRPIDEELRAADPSLDQHYLATPSYHTEEMKAYLGSLGRDNHSLDAKIRGLRRKRIGVLDGLTRTIIRQALAEQTIDNLTETPYLLQGSNDMGESEAGVAQGCANACFRMAYGALVGEAPTAAEVMAASLEAHGSHLIPNTDYLNLFHSEAFRSALGREVLTYDLVGASLTMISKLAANARKKWDGAKVVCVVPLASETKEGLREPLVVHQSVLLAATKESVYLHDPSRRRHAGPHREMSKQTFIERWAIGLNEAMVIVAV